MYGLRTRVDPVPTSSNNNLQLRGFERRAGVGEIQRTPDVPGLEEQQHRVPKRPCFLYFNAAGSSAPMYTLLEHGGVDNVTKLEIAAIRLTGIGGAPPEVIAIRFMGGASNSLKHKCITNFNTVPDDAIFMNVTGADTYQAFGTPLSLYQSKEAFNLTNIQTRVLDMTGAEVTYTHMYVWLFVETLNLQ